MSTPREWSTGLELPVDDGLEVLDSHMSSLRPREIPVSLHSLPKLLSYLDGEGKGGVGVALWLPSGKTIA